jgi:hypothetical protein
VKTLKRLADTATLISIARITCVLPSELFLTATAKAELIFASLPWTFP